MRSARGSQGDVLYDDGVGSPQTLSEADRRIVAALQAGLAEPDHAAP